MSTQSADAPKDESLWTVTDTARYLQMSPSWVYRRTESGEIPHAKLGGAIRYLPARVREYAERLANTAPGGNVIRLRKR
jgi:excisionase family DNA binding protein